MTNNTDLDSIFHRALKIESPSARVAFLNDACKGDQQLQEEIKRLLEAHTRASGPLDRSPLASDSTISPSVLNSIGADAGTIPRVTLRESADRAQRNDVSPELPKEKPEGRYQMHGEIARGGMGAIIRGRDTDLGRELVFKVLLDAHRDKPEYVRRFVEEAQIGGQLQHPGIVPIYELGRLNDQRPFFTMKLVKGDTLAALLNERQSTREEQSKFVGIFAQVCQTVAYAHSKGVIHRDLKPANIMVGAFGEVQVMDWGLAKVVATGGVPDERQSTSRRTEQSVIQTLRSIGSDTGDIAGSDTRLGSIMGTLAYMPPEQALGETDRLDERADVFALGAILAEILTGSPAYVGGESSALHRLAAGGKLDDCHARLDGSEAEPELTQLAKDCLAPEPLDRPKNADVVAARVADFQASMAARLKQSELELVASETRAAEETRRRKLLRIGIIAAVVTGIAMAVAAVEFRKLSNQNLQLAQQERIRRLSSDARATQADRPVRSALIAREAARVSRQVGTEIAPKAHEALLNAAPLLEGFPLPRSDNGVHDLEIRANRLVTVEDEACYVWDLTARNPITSPRKLEEPGVNALSISTDGNALLTNSDRLLYWNLQLTSGPVVLANGPMRRIQMSRDGNWAVTQDEAGDVVRWDLSEPEKPTSRLLLEASAPQWGAISPDGQWIAAAVAPNGRRTEYVTVLRVTGDEVNVFLPKTSDGRPCQELAMDPLGRWLITESVSASASADEPDQRNGLRKWDLLADEAMTAPIDFPQDFRSMSRTTISPDGRWLFCWADHERITRIDLSHPTLPAVDIPTGNYSRFAVSNDGAAIADALVSGDIQFWDIANQEHRTFRLRSHDSWAREALMSENGQWLASRDSSGAARLWQIRNRVPQSALVLRDQHFGLRPKFAISSSGRWIAVEADTNEMHLVDLSQSPPGTPFGSPSLRVISDADPNSVRHEKPVTFTNNDRWLVFGEQSRVLLYDLVRGRLPPVSLEACLPVRVSADNKLYWFSVNRNHPC